MADPIAALAVAKTMASAATSTVSERDNASLVFLFFILKYRLFSALGFASSISLDLIGFRVSPPLRRLCYMLGYFDYAVSISLRPQKFPNGPQPPCAVDRGLPRAKAPRQIIFFTNLTLRHLTLENTGFSCLLFPLMAFLCPVSAPPAPQQFVQFVHARTCRRHIRNPSRD